MKVSDALRQRRSIRAFDDRPVDADLLRSLLWIQAADLVAATVRRVHRRPGPCPEELPADVFESRRLLPHTIRETLIWTPPGAQ